MTTVEFEVARHDSPESYRKFVQKPQEIDKMPTLNDVYQLAERTDQRLDAVEDKLNTIEAELRVAIRGLMEAVPPKS